MILKRAKYRKIYVNQVNLNPLANKNKI